MQVNELLPENVIHRRDVRGVCPERVVDCSECYVPIWKPYYMVIKTLTASGTRERCTSYELNRENERSSEGRPYFA